MDGANEIVSLVTKFKDVSPVSYVFGFFLLSLLPWALLSLTSFLKISVVLSILRNALGANGIPSGAITSLLAIALTIHVMTPTFYEISDGIKAGLQSVKATAGDGERLLGVLSGARTPLVKFLAKHSKPAQREYFREHNLEADGCVETFSPELCLYTGENFGTLVPAFIFSELSRAFSLGFLIFLPFLIVDVLVAVVLVGMGMTMLNPVSVSLPLKLLLLVAADGWFELGKALVAGYH